MTDVSHGSKDGNPVEPSIKPPGKAVFSFLASRLRWNIQDRQTQKSTAGLSKDKQL
jgi:hypothetical protein